MMCTTLTIIHIEPVHILLEVRTIDLLGIISDAEPSAYYPHIHTIISTFTLSLYIYSINNRS